MYHIAAAVNSFCYTPGQFALTFDEGPNPNTKDVLAALEQKKVKATFHIVTKYLNTVSVFTNLQETERAGHIIGLRFPTEVDPSKASDETIRKVLRTESQLVYNAIKKYPKYLRLPAGKDDDRVVQIAQEEGFVVTRWNFDSLDYTNGLNVATVVADLNQRFRYFSR